MLLFSRILQTAGSPRRVMPWVSEITAYVNAHSDMEVACWSATFGYPLGTVGWSSIVESQAALAASTAALSAQDGYFDLVEAGADLVPTPGYDVLREIVHGAPSSPPPMGAVVQINTATAVLDRMDEAMAWSVDIAQHVEGVTGSPVSLLVDVYGQMGGVAWIAVAADAAAADAARAALATDEGYMKRISGSRDLFVPASGHSAQMTRIA